MTSLILQAAVPPKLTSIHPFTKLLLTDTCIWKLSALQSSSYTNIGSFQRGQLLLGPSPPCWQLDQQLSDASLQNPMIICTHRRACTCSSHAIPDTTYPALFKSLPVLRLFSLRKVMKSLSASIDKTKVFFKCRFWK